MNEKPTVYIIDKDTAVLDSLCALLGVLDVDIKTYSRAESFLDEAALSDPACLITELYLPGMTGIDLLDSLHARGDRIPTIVLASASDVPTAVRTMRAGAIDFIDKPAIGGTLLQRVRQALYREGD